MTDNQSAGGTTAAGLRPVVQIHEGLLGETASATFSEDRAYRYALTRVWNADRPLAAFVMLNPSTADAFVEDPTIRRCLGFARAWGCGGLLVLNLFGLRSTDPAALHNHPDPVGPDNDTVITEALSLGGPHEIGPVVAAWGAHGMHLDRDRHVTSLLGRPAQCLGVTKDGQPRHPLYVPAVTALAPFTRSTEA